MNTDMNLAQIAQHFNSEDAARSFMERLRWPDGPVCPHCGSREAYRLTPKAESKRPVRAGVLKCKACRRQFTVQVGTIFEDSHIPLNKWLMAFHLVCSSKKGVSSHQLHRMLGVSYKSGWFMAMRIRYAMSQPPLADKLAGIVEVDETYVGGKEHQRGRPGRESKKVPVVALIERGGRVRSFKVDDVKARTLKGVIRRNVADTAHIMTDSLRSYRGLEKEFASHGVVDHGQEYVRGIVHTNFAESYFSLLKRGILGTFHHVSHQHMQRYLDEFSFRWTLRGTSDGERTAEAIKGGEGKRLMLREPVDG